jgi:CheY-like chemotaxis protein
MEETKYCICCGEHVPVDHINLQDLMVLSCRFCGFPVAEDMEFLSSVQEAPEQREKKFGSVLCADDSQFTTKLIHDLLDTHHLADTILTFENGLDLTSAFSKFVSENKPVDVLILDINMPVMDGITAARVIRSIEKQNNLPKTPIAFFSAIKAGENLRNAMKMFAPAFYLNKGTDPNPDNLSKRVEKLLSYIMDMKKG